MSVNTKRVCKKNVYWTHQEKSDSTMEKDYIIIQWDGTPTQFMDGEIVIYGDYEEAKSDIYPDDMGICEIGYRVENGTQIAYVSKPDSDVLLGSFDYDDKIDNFQVRLKEFLNEHPLC